MITPPDAVPSLLHPGDESTRPLRPSLGVGGFFVMILLQLTFMCDLHCCIGLGLGLITSMR